MIKAKVSHLLREKLGSKATVSNRAKEIKKDYGPMSSNDAYYVLAHLSDIDLSQHLTLVELDRIRSLVPKDKRMVPPSSPIRTKARKKHQIYPLVNSNTISVGERIGSELYPLLFALENSVRELISQKYSAIPDWWDKKAPDDVKKNVARTMKKEMRFSYRGKRGSHPLSYSNFKDLKEIIVHNESDFATVILRMDWFKVWMDEIYMVRNNIAHCVPISQDDRTKLSVFHRDWARLLISANMK